MHTQPAKAVSRGHPGAAAVRAASRETTLRRALAKRQAGVPSYTVAEAAALLSISPEHLYRLIRSGQFPAVLMRAQGRYGRWIVPAVAVEKLLDRAAATGAPVDLTTWGGLTGSGR